MYYRYIVKTGTTEHGITQIMNPDERRKMGQFLANPKWYTNHPDTPSEAWFTDYGYRTYHKNMEKLIEQIIKRYQQENKTLGKILLIRRHHLPFILRKGKVQVIAQPIRK